MTRHALISAAPYASGWPSTRARSIPLTNGHVDIIMRGARLFDRIIVAILVQPREDAAVHGATSGVDMAREVFRDEPHVEVDTFGGLLVDYAQRRGAHVIVRGLRAVSDFEYEFQMALMNRRLVPEHRDRVHDAGRSRTRTSVPG